VPGFTPSVSFADGAREILAYHDADPERQRVDPELDRAFDALLGIADTERKESP
jgi:hypothetical protein